jgi:hypothetical protein
MRPWALAVLAACGSTPSTSTVSSTGIAPSEPPPAHVLEHRHDAPAHADDPDKLYVEISSDGDHGELLRQSAMSGLGAVPYAVAADTGADVELHVELASLSPAANATSCKVKIFVLRLPQHDLLGIADGGARATGPRQADTCLSTIGTAIVREKLPVLLRRQLDAKR